MKVLLVSTYKISCGIAAYTEGLETLLAKDFDLTVFPLDQSILKSKVPHVALAGDQLVKDLCAQFKDFDVVNLQWEPGLLGHRQDQMARRLGWILEAADNLILTVHTVVPYPDQLSVFEFLRYVRRRGAKAAPLYFLNSDRRYQKETYRILHERAKSGKSTVVAVHTERETQFFRNVVGFKNVVDHPLSLIHEDWPERLKRDTPKARADLEELFPGRSTFIGVFGFLSEYKGVTTALRAMKMLDSEHQLLIYGGVHPGVLKEGAPVDPYVKKLMSEIEGDAVLGSRGGASGRAAQRSIETEPWETEPTNGFDPMSRDQGTDEFSPAAEEADTVDGAGASAAKSRRKNANVSVSYASPGNTLMEKVAFLGAPDDYEFALAISAVDICLFPYLEVGQSGSGPVSIAIELGKKAIVSRTKAFIELAKYHPKHFEMIDIGNHIQLAQAVQRLSRTPPVKVPVHYNKDTLASFYGQLIRSFETSAPSSGDDRSGVIASPSSASSAGGHGRAQAS